MSETTVSAGEAASLLKDGRFMRFWCARLLTVMGFQMMSVVVGWDVYAMSGKPLYLGLLGLAQFVPMVLATLPAGYVADHFDRRLVMQVCMALEAVAMGFLAWASLEGWISVPVIFAAVTLMGAVRSFERPVMAALLPTIVNEATLPKALAFATSGAQTATIVGPALGGLIYIAGPDVAYAAVACCYVLASTLMAVLGMARRPRVKKPMSLETMLSGLRFIRSRPVVLGAISLDLMAVLLGGSTALLPVYAHDILHVGPTGLGILRGAPAVGALLVSAVLVRRPLKRRAGLAMFYGVALFGVATIVFGLSRSYALSCLALAVMGGADVVSVVVRGALVQLRTPDDMRGRVSAVSSLFIGTSNQFGEFESGTTAALMGTVPAVVAGGLGTLLVVALWMRWFPALRKVDRLDAGAS